jgi:archaellin
MMAVKKLLVMLVLAGFLCGTLVGCSGTTTEKAKTTPPATTSGTSEKPPDKPKD